MIIVVGQNAKKHLSERLKKTDDKLESQKDLLKGVQDNVRMWYNLVSKAVLFFTVVFNKFLRSMEQVGLTLEDLAKIGDDFYAMHNMFGDMVRVTHQWDSLYFLLITRR